MFFWRAENQLFFFFFLKERNEEESSGEEAILFEEVFLLTAHTFANLAINSTLRSIIH